MSGIDAIVTDHFEMFFRDMPDETFDEIHDRQSFLHILVVFMAVIVESDGIPVIPVNSGSGNYRPAKVAADILNDLTGIALIRHSSDIEPIVVVCIDAGFYFFKRIPQPFVQFVEESGLKGIP